MTDAEHEMKEIVLRDIEPILSEKIDKDLVVESFTNKLLLPPGENYGSTIMKVVVNLKNKKTGKEEELHLIAKMPPPTEFQRKVFNSPRTFTKEIFMYESIMPAYNKLELECGFRKNEVFDVLAKFYGSRLSLQADGEFDDNAVILMENLKVKGYYNGDRTKGYDLEHAELAVKALARFHALGMATKEKKPGMYEIFKMYAKALQAEGTAEDMFKVVLNTIQQDPEMSPHYERCDKILSGFTLEKLWAEEVREPWSTIIHSDFWVNNIMFHRSEKGKIDDVKFVDFQIYLCASPLRDLLFFVYSSVEPDVVDDQAENLFDLYYETMINVLTKMKCNTNVFSKEDFRAKLAEDAKNEFVHVSFMIKVLTLDVKDISDFNVDKLQSVMLEHCGNQLFVERLRKLVLNFVKHDWI
ncbi:uncharacterized protein LOC108624753 [Ceratina calcarata]|uniref:Uncharacterized protein LOC108624753 n=1 Tax=Ceratina calcarata TaxID=156304 RepID=A0AAJ7IYL4_9HYME|nr:uncharacterized protein LOC108624753 [Ceratina calcarata]